MADSWVSWLAPAASRTSDIDSLIEQLSTRFVPVERVQSLEAEVQQLFVHHAAVMTDSLISTVTAVQTERPPLQSSQTQTVSRSEVVR